MGIYLNPTNDMFTKAVNSEIYVDKTNMIQYTNRVLNTTQQNICVSRPRRFGKSITANMLTAYYSRGCDSKDLFKAYNIGETSDFEKYLNQYDVIFLNMQEFLSRTHNMEDMLSLIKKSITWDLIDVYSNVRLFDETDLVRTMQDIYSKSNTPFVVIIDEWDCIFREYKDDKESQELYLDFLRDFLKDKGYIHLAYMTGILPIKKYGTHSALNMFDEFSMVDAGPLEEFVGFTEQEVTSLCSQYQISMEQMKEWYDGYQLETIGSVYSPRSVISSLRFRRFNNYWNQTETFEALRIYIDMNFDGLKDDILNMMSGNAIPVNVTSFVNDMTTFSTEDDVLTLLIHLGYLGYHSTERTAYIPNHEIMNEYANAVAASDWGAISKALKNSADTLAAIWNKQPAIAVKGIEQAHFETSHLQYNDENALSYTIALALYAAHNFYSLYRELPTGKGFADMVFLPRKNYPDKPALLVELKWDQSAYGAINQIKERKYTDGLKDYHGNLLLVGINYDKQSKEHQCIIEEMNL